MHEKITFFSSMILMFIIIISSNINAQTIVREKGHAFSGTLLLGFDGGSTFAITDYERSKPNFVGKINLDYYFPTESKSVFGIRAFGLRGVFGGRINSENKAETFRTPYTSIGGGLIYSLSIKDAVFPYILFGGSYVMTNPQDLNNNKLPRNSAEAYSTKTFAYNSEVGLKFILNDALSLDLNLGFQLADNDNYDDLAIGNTNDMIFTTMVGLSYSFFTSNDTDQDGVLDEYDQCPNTPLNVKVDEFGCPFDSDNDGVPDYKDKCPNTPSNVEVNENGCAEDSDLDGVPNYLDKCPNTKAGLKVNEDGCPDTDNDGVADNIDKCPDTPSNAKVDENGCPLDSDKDGVPDYLDKCENTPAGKQVDENGCATEVVVKEKIKKIVLSGDTNFEFNKTSLLPSAYDKLNSVVKTMKDYPNSRWMIEGYTDAIGSNAYNQKLSLERARSVGDYFVKNGIERNRLELNGNGESNPIANNSTPEGRAMNRRVEIKLIEDSINKEK